MRTSRQKIRYAVVGLGHIAQVAVLPAFAHAARNTTLAALVSDNSTKLRELGGRYRVENRYTYDEYDDCLNSGEIDAVYIALPNSMHAEYSIRAANAGIHVLVEKPMAVTEKECLAMIRAASKHRVKLMVAYRLHFERANLQAVELSQSGKLGKPRFFTSAFSLQVRPRNIRTKRELGGGTLYDLGIYCVNAARYLFRDEPREAIAYSVAGIDRRFKEVDEMTAAVLRFPQDRLATFTSSFGAADVSTYEIAGTRGTVRLDPAYEYAFPLKLYVTIDGKTRSQIFPKRDQFAPELLHFSDCILQDREPEPSGLEGLADVRTIEALYRSAKIGKPVKIRPVALKKRASLKQERRRPPVKKPALVQAKSGSL
jgi:glucose-fructose oxidoreductase